MNRTLHDARGGQGLPDLPAVLAGLAVPASRGVLGDCALPNKTETVPTTNGATFYRLVNP